MKNFKEFKNQLEKLDANESSDLSALQKALKNGSNDSPSEQEQRWAWSRLEAYMATPEPEPASFFWLRFSGWGALASLALLILVSIALSPETLRPPVVLNVDSTMNAVAFHSPEAQADVIWVNGYEYMSDGVPIQ